MAVGAAATLALTACSSSTDTPEGDGTSAGAVEAADITLWLAGGDTNDDLRAYLVDTFAAENPGSTLTIEEQPWGDLDAKLTTALPDANNTPDVVEVGNTQSPTYTNVGAFLDISDMYDELGGDDLLQSFVAAGEVDGLNYTLPYYFGSRYMFVRKDVWAEAGLEMPTTLDEFNSSVKAIAAANPRGIDNFSGFFLGGQDWRNGISWIFANGGDLATKDGDEWVSTLSDPNSITGLTQLQEIYESASNAPADAKDASPWLYLNDTDEAMDADGAVTASTSLAAATIMAPGWAHWSIGDLVTGEDGKPAREWNDATFGVLVLPGVDGEPAPVFAGGSNIGISAKSEHPELAKALLRIIFSDEYQQLLGGAGLGPANQTMVSSLGDDQFAQALIASASNSKLTPAAPGWASVESSKVLEEFFSKISTGGDVTALAQEYDEKITPMLNGNAG
ncbi:extracellular solute-binding protein [Pengzhenrongella sicca]|uniref:extracellular solute-binding protein n=1 Tax=Pengzhenrongella sicca TaxID=2819238 RepID=UPI001D0CBEB0|nr:extracellular solute-binding protein [Pengzhenrongella sicca]